MTSKKELIKGDDDLPADEVGAQAEEKHTILRKYVDICRAVRKKYLGSSKGGATYIDLFAGTGRARIRETGKWIDGSAVAAWKTSQKGGAPFSEILISDINETSRRACVQRLRKLDAPVKELHGSALEVAKQVVRIVNQRGLHFAFLDPYNLGELDFSIIQALSYLKRIDMLIHVSAMDLQRNLERHMAEDAAFDVFAPGWRSHVDIKVPIAEIRRQLFDYWRNKVANLGTYTTNDVRLVTGDKNQKLYWLLLAAKHEQAHKFWKEISNIEKQGKLGL